MTEQTTTPNIVATPVEPLPASNLRLTSAPIQADLLREYFANKDIFFVIDYSQSKLKGAQLITYLTNLSLPFDIMFGEKPCYEDYSEFMKAYFAQTSIIECAGAHVMAADILLTAKGFNRAVTPYRLPIPNEFVTSFIEQNKETLDRAMHFIDSAGVFALSSIPALDKHYRPRENYPLVEDRTYVSQNLAFLFAVPEFTGIYFSIEGATYRQSYFTHQFEDYLFKNKRLAHFFGNHANIVSVIYTCHAAGFVELDTIDFSLLKTGVFDKNSPNYVSEEYVPLSIEALQERQPDNVGDAAAGDAVPSES